MARDDVVPWSMARMKSGMLYPLRVWNSFIFDRHKMLPKRFLFPQRSKGIVPAWTCYRMSSAPRNTFLVDEVVDFALRQ